MKSCFYLIFALMLLISCQEKEQKVSVETKKESTAPKPKYDLNTVVVTNDNVVDFLTWYGSFNPEKEFVIHTKFGDIEVELFEDTPLHRANMIYLIKKKYFDTTFFHRVVKGFVVQGGNSDESITGKMRKNIGEDYTIPSEFTKNHQHEYGALCAARSWDNNPEKRSNPYEFYFVQSKKGEHHLNFEHTVYGKITKGFEVLDKIASQPTDKGEYPLLNINMTVELK